MINLILTADQAVKLKHALHFWTLATAANIEDGIIFMDPIQLVWSHDAVQICRIEDKKEE